MIHNPNHFSNGHFPDSLELSFQDRFAPIVDEACSIVVSLDGGTVAEQALPHAVELARRWEVPLRLVQVVSPLQRRDENDLGLMINPGPVSQVEHAEAYLQRVAHAIEIDCDIPVIAQTLESLSVDDALRNFCREDAALLVMAKPQRSTLDQWLFGSVTNRLVGKLSVPLLVVPALDNTDREPAVDYRRILVAVSEGDERRSVLSAAAALAFDEGQCHLLHVLPPQAAWLNVRGVPARRLNLPEEAWLHVLRAREWLEERSIAVGSHLVDHSYSPAKAILAKARSLDADLIVLGTHYHFLPWWLQSGVTQYVVRHATAPVLLIPSDSDLPARHEAHHVDLYSDEASCH